MQVDVNQFYGESESSLSIKELSDYGDISVPSEFPDTNPDETKGAAAQFFVDTSVPFVFNGNSHSVDELVRHQVSKYLNFMSVKELNVIRVSQSDLWVIPTDRGRIFADKHLKLTEKRALMTLFKAAAHTQSASVHSTTLVGGDSSNQDATKPIVLDSTMSAISFLLSIHISRPEIVLGIIHGVCMYPLPADTMTALDMMTRIGNFIGSLDAYEPGCPFLIPTFGNGDIPQSFARIAAVHGATQILGCSYETIKAELRENDYVLIDNVCTQQRSDSIRVIHGVVGSRIAESDPQHVSLSVIIEDDPNFAQHPIYCLTVPHPASGETRPGACPPGTCSRHFFSILSDEQSDVERIGKLLARYGNDNLIFERMFIENKFSRDPKSFFDIDSFIHSATAKFNQMIGKDVSDPLPVPPPSSNTFEETAD